jgi:hypothetical protein
MMRAPAGNLQLQACAVCRTGLSPMQATVSDHQPTSVAIISRLVRYLRDPEPLVGKGTVTCCRDHCGPDEGRKHHHYCKITPRHLCLHSPRIIRTRRERSRCMLKFRQLFLERRTAMSVFVDFAEVKERCSIVDAVALLGLKTTEERNQLRHPAPRVVTAAHGPSSSPRQRASPLLSVESGRRPNRVGLSRQRHESKGCSGLDARPISAKY